jgi:3-hydroxyacyl-[acyl-carrier-protein] dehydratase
MRFQLIDRILELVPGKSIQAVKNLTLGEEYLADHFPSFPVLPGVLMLEGLVQAAAWLVRVSEEYAHSMIVLREAKGVKYGNFVQPGRQLRLKVDQAGPPESDRSVSFKGSGEVDGLPAVSARFTLARYNLADRDPAMAALDNRLVRHYKELWSSLRFRS